MIEFQNVSKVYPDGTEAVRDFSLVAASRETTVLVGTSGSGKTTVLRMVNRMVEPSAGRVLWDGADVAAMDPVRLRRSIGYVLQEGGLFPHWTVLDNISTVPRLEGATKRDAARRASELLELVGLDAELGSRYPAQLSGGQRQRVGVARALANEPLVLLMDEPFGALDPLVRRDLHLELKRIREALGTTILMVTHDMHEAMTLGHKVVVMRKGGRIVQEGPPAAIMESPADGFVRDFLDASGMQRFAPCERLDARPPDQPAQTPKTREAAECDDGGRPGFALLDALGRRLHDQTPTVRRRFGASACAQSPQPEVPGETRFHRRSRHSEAEGRRISPARDVGDSSPALRMTIKTRFPEPPASNGAALPKQRPAFGACAPSPRPEASQATLGGARA